MADRQARPTGEGSQRLQAPEVGTRPELVDPVGTRRQGGTDGLGLRAPLDRQRSVPVVALEIGSASGVRVADQVDVHGHRLSGWRASGVG